MVNANHIPVGAHYGFGDWLLQRVTAIVMAVYTVVIGGTLLFGDVLSQDRWKSLLSGNCMRILTFLFILSLCFHAWVGVRDIWMDYVKSVSTRLTLHILTALMLIGCAGWASQILWRL